MMRSGALLAILILLQGVSCTSPRRVTEAAQDPYPAIQGGDVTALIEGCGEQLSLGFLVCRKKEGETAGDTLTFVAPPVKCKGSGPCVTFKIFFVDGTPTYGGVIAQGKTRQDVSWKSILKRDTFQMGDRGFWGYSYTIRYVLEDGIERVTYSQGEIYLRVLKKGYHPLNSIQEDPHFVWKWKERGRELKSTNGMRTWIEKK
jgi:hypothetical protein